MKSPATGNVVLAAQALMHHQLQQEMQSATLTETDQRTGDSCFQPANQEVMIKICPKPADTKGVQHRFLHLTTAARPRQTSLGNVVLKSLSCSLPFYCAQLGVFWFRMCLQTVLVCRVPPQHHRLIIGFLVSDRKWILPWRILGHVVCHAQLRATGSGLYFEIV